MGETRPKSQSLSCLPAPARPTARSLPTLGILLHFLLLAAGLGCSRAPAPQVPRAHPAEVAALTSKDAQIGSLITQAEAALQAGQLADAAATYGTISERLPSSGFPYRRQCEILTALGHKTEAQAACARAIEFGSSVRDLRAAVGVAMMPAATPPTVEQLVDAVMMAAGTRRQVPSQAFGYAAFVDIAKRVGDWDMMRTQLAELDRVAPDSDETRRAHAQMPRPWIWWRILGLGFLALATLAAAGRTCQRLWRTRAGASRTALVAVVLGFVSLFDTGAHAAAKAKKPASPPAAEADEKPPEVNAFSRFQIDDADPEGTLPIDKANSDPLQFAYLLMDIAGKAEDAGKRGDHHTAIKYYRALAKAVPGRAISYSRMCKSYEALGERNNALDACRKAMGADGVELDDYQRFVGLVVNFEGALTARERDDVLAVVAHLRAGPPASVVVAHDLQCQFATRVGDTKRLEECVAGLVKAVPKEGKTIAYQWSLAIAKGDHDAAARLVQRAKFAGIKPAGIAKMTDATKAMIARRWSAPLWMGGALAATAIIVAAFLYLRRSRSSQQPAQNPA